MFNLITRKEILYVRSLMYNLLFLHTSTLWTIYHDYVDVLVLIPEIIFP